MGTKVNPVVKEDDNRRQCYIPIDQILRPIHVSMRLFGVYFSRDIVIPDDEANDQPHSKVRRFTTSLSKWYCVAFTLISGIASLRYIPAFWVGIDFKPNLTILRVINFSWILQCFLNRIILLRACWSDVHLSNLFRKFDSIIMDTTTCRMDSKCHKSQKCVVINTIVAWMVSLVSMVSIIFQSVTDYQPEFVAAITNPLSDNLVALNVAFVGLHTLETGAWLFPVLYQVTLFRILRQQFVSFNNNLEKMLKDDGARFAQKIKEMRLKHLELCKIVGILEQDTKYLIAVNYVTNTFITCFVVYQMVTGVLSVSTYITYSSWLVMNVSITTSVSVTAAMVNEQVRIRLCIFL